MVNVITIAVEEATPAEIAADLTVNSAEEPRAALLAPRPHRPREPAEGAGDVDVPARPTAPESPPASPPTPGPHAIAGTRMPPS